MYGNVSWIQYGISYMYTLFSGLPTANQIQNTLYFYRIYSNFLTACAVS